MSLHAMNSSTYMEVCDQFAQSIFLPASCSYCDLRSMLSNRHPLPLTQPHEDTHKHAKTLCGLSMNLQRM